MAKQPRPPRQIAAQPLESADLRDFKVSPDRLDEALRVLKQVLGEETARHG